MRLISHLFFKTLFQTLLKIKKNEGILCFKGEKTEESMKQQNKTLYNHHLH